MEAGEMVSQLILAVVLLSALSAILVAGEGSSYKICPNGVVNVNTDQWGYITSDNYPGGYGYNMNCMYEFQVSNPQYEYVAFHVNELTFDVSGYTDRITVWATDDSGSWYSVKNVDAYSDPNWLNTFQIAGKARLYWYTDAYKNSSFHGVQRWSLTFSYQKYVFGCELSPQPYYIANTTRSGILQSPFFPDHYPVNVQCTTIIDVDQAVDAIEFVTVQFKFRPGDFLYFYVGDAQLNNWYTYNVYSGSTGPGTFTIYGADVQVIFSSDYVAVGLGYYIYWRVISKEKYPIYKPESLMGYWPMTAAHRGNDIVQGCNADTYPPSTGTLKVAHGPADNPGAALYLGASSLSMSSTTCQASTKINGSFTISMFAQTAVNTALVEFNPTLTTMHLWSHYLGAGNFFINDQAGHTVSGPTSLPLWQYLSATSDVKLGKLNLYADSVAKYTGAGSTAAPPATSGFLFGTRSGGTPQTGRFSCLSMYSQALSPADLAQTRAMCQKFQDQYQIHPGSSLVGWWPLSSTASSMARDFSGNGNHGIVKSTTDVTMTAGPSGTTNRAFSFAGTSNSYVSFPYSMNILKSFTVSVFIKSTSGLQQPLVQWLNADGSRGMPFWNSPGQNDIYFSLNYVAQITKTSIGFSSWKLVSGSYEASTGILTIWVDGVVVLTQTVGTNVGLLVSTQGFLLGNGGPGAPGSPYLGQMACLSLYKSALTAAQLLQIRAACLTDINQPPILVELVGFWPFIGLTKFLDISGNEHPGVPKSSNITSNLGPFNLSDSGYALGADSLSYINVASTAVNLGTRSWTIACYVQSYVTNLDAPLLEYVDGSNNPGIYIWLKNNNLIVSDGNTVTITSTAAWDQAGWHFLAATYEVDTKTLSAYRDGALVASVGSSTPKTTSMDAFNVGARVSGTQRLKANVSCLVIYSVALTVDGIGRVLSMCNSYIMDTQMRDQTRSLEINCNFDYGFCGWYQDTTDDGNWALDHDATPTGQPYIFSTGPRVGISVERADALDQYALLNANVLGFSMAARIISPVIPIGWHCFEFWYYMAGKTVNQFRVYILQANQQLFSRNTFQGKNWRFTAQSFYLSSADQLVIEGTTGTTIYSDIAIDNLRLTDGFCTSTVPCPRGWIDNGRKCYMNFMNMPQTFSAATTHCETRAKARLARPEDSQELAFLQSYATSTMHIDGTLSSSIWVNTESYPIIYKPWSAGHPLVGATTAALTSTAFISVTGTPSYGFFCEVTKLEAQYLGFNCTFDGKHLCGWWNVNNDNNEYTYGAASFDVDVWGGLSMVYDYSQEDGQNGPEYDFHLGNTRGYYAMIEDNTSPSCGSAIFTDFYSPVMKGTGRAQCLRFRGYRTSKANNMVTVYQYTLDNAGAATWQSPLSVNGFQSNIWMTWQVEYWAMQDYMIVIRLWSSCTGLGNIAIDDVVLFDSTCSSLLYGWAQADNTNSLYYFKQSNRPPFPSWEQSTDVVGDDSMNSCDLGSGWKAAQWRGYQRGTDAGSWTCALWWRTAGARRTGPTVDYSGQYYYLSIDVNSGNSLTDTGTFVGPPIPRGQHCFIFHYFASGYDIGELRLLDDSGRSLWAVQGPQSPAWREHRILFDDTNPTYLYFEGSSGYIDNATHFQKYDSLQLDDFYTRNGTDLCFGFMDCNFDQSASVLDCGWWQNDTDDADWVRNHGETPAGNANTGPGADQTTGNGHYLYFEATGVRPGATARVHMPPIASGVRCLTFYYYMWGQDMGSLRVFYVARDNLENSNGTFPPYSEVTLWQKSGNQGNMWVRAMVPLSFSYSQILTFEAMRGNGDRADIAIDDVILLKGNCPMDRSYSCSFERADLCSWYQDWTDQQDFTFNQGTTVDAPAAGPSGDATGAYAGGYYAVLLGSTSNAGDIARIISPLFPPGTICFQMAYNMHGVQPGYVALYKDSSMLLRARSGSTGFDWQHMTLTIPSNSTFTLQIEAQRGASPKADISIDDITITDGPCPGDNFGLPVANVIQYTSYKGYALLEHNITAPFEVDMADCVLLCRGNPACFSLNYESNTSTCVLNDSPMELDPFNFFEAPSSWTYLTLLTPFAQNDTKMNNICTLDSPTCTVSQNCSTMDFTKLFVCQCIEPGRSCYMPQDCSAAKDANYFATGAYLIQPTLTSPPFMAYCRSTPKYSGAHTVIASRMIGGLRFHGRKLAEYQQFFGSANREFWIGLEAMTTLTNSFQYGYTLTGSLYGASYTKIQSPAGSTTYFKVANAANNYKVTLDPVGTMMTTMNNAKFSAIDADQTGTNSCAASNADSGWWFANSASCTNGLLTGPYRPNEAVGTTKDGLYVADWGSGIGITQVEFSIQH